jgi:ubiquinone biosynthesis protein
MLVRYFAAPLLRRLLGRRPQARDAPARLRRLLESNGVTAIKIGQYLAIRRDLFSAETCAELSRLFDAVPALPYPAVRAAVEGELGRPLDSCFSEFDAEPLGAASIAQVHRARLPDGRLVAVKVQRPDVADRLRADFRILRGAARLADRLDLLGALRALDLVREVEAFTLREIDFVEEGRTAERIGTDPGRGVHVPAIFWELSTGRLLVMELIEGVPLSRVIERTDAGQRRVFEEIAPGVSPARIVDRLCDAFLRQLFLTGVFQGDPHPANIMVERDGTIALIDFGIFGELGAADRALLSAYVESLSLGRFEQAFRCYLPLVQIGERTDFEGFRDDVTRVLRAWHAAASDPAAPVGARLTARYQGEIFEAMRRHHVRMGGNHLLFWRAIGVLDSTAHRLPVRFDLLSAMRRFFALHRPSLLARAGRAGRKLVAGGAERTIDAARMLDRWDRMGPFKVETRLARASRRAAAHEAKAAAAIVAAAALAAHAVAAAPGAAAVLLVGAALAATASAFKLAAERR